jgi:hypothetical protein
MKSQDRRAEECSDLFLTSILTVFSSSSTDRRFSAVSAFCGTEVTRIQCAKREHRRQDKGNCFFLSFFLCNFCDFIQFNHCYRTFIPQGTKCVYRNSPVRIATGWTAGVRFPVRAREVSPQRSDRLWGPPSLLSDEYGGFFPG